MYRLHKWLGITALTFAVIHWLWGQGAKWAVGWGWLTRPERGRGSAEAFGAVERFFRHQRALAETIGEWAFYAAVVLIVLALVQRFPNRLFVKTHKWLAIVYFALVFHTVVLMKFDYWTKPVGLLMALLLIGGTLSALVVLLGRVGASRQVRGHIESLIDYPELRVLETVIALQPGWQGHKAGQFAFVTSSEAEGAHPYTIASAWDDQTRQIVFITKELGDYTSKLRERLKVGTAVKVEGPYGCFTFGDQTSRQIWIGAGIGITPFIARMNLNPAVGGWCDVARYCKCCGCRHQVWISGLTQRVRARRLRALAMRGVWASRRLPVGFMWSGTPRLRSPRWDSWRSSSPT
jgi:predicted ferric reductase